jgi:diacylglycerol kinase (ATP)
MNLVLYFNPRSGSGAAERVAETLSRALKVHGHEAKHVEANGASTGIEAADAMVVIGGDGTVHSILDKAAAASLPIYHFPTGTENLFAREFGMNRQVPTLLAALEEKRIVEVDIARCAGRPFIIMCGVGPDASVVHRLARTRTGRITHWSYARPIFAELRDPALAPLSVWVDGEEVVSERSGWLVVANSRQYGLRMDPARHADITDGLLDVVFFAARSSWGVLGWGAITRLRLQHHFKSATHARGREVRIECPERALPMQLDGEAGHMDIGAASAGATITIQAKRLQVLMPT